MSRLSQTAFAVLVLATVAAFFVTQHLKSSTPVLTGFPAPYPSTFSPGQTGCMGSYGHTQVSFYLLHRADDVSVYVVDQSGSIVRTLASGRHMRRGVRKPDGVFEWDGRQDNGSLAPDGSYHLRVALIHQNRSIVIAKPIVLRTVAPHPVITRVAPALLPVAGGASIAYAGNEGHLVTVLVYRTDLPGGPRLLTSFLSRGPLANWNGKIRGRPAPQGTYLIGLSVTDAACNTGRFPPQIPPTPGSTTHAGVTVRYLAAEPALDPVPAGGTATVYVDSRHQPYDWALRRLGSARSALAMGTQSAPALHVSLPRGAASLYELAIRTNASRTEVPIIGRASPPQRGGILVVLPALTWQGQNAGDEDGDGLADTLDAGAPISLLRPLATGLPPGFADEAGFLAYLDHAHLPYDLTTDLGLIDGAGPGLYGHSGVVLAGSERWLPSSLYAPLRSYVKSGGRVLSLGIASLQRSVSIQGARALSPTPPAAVDFLDATPGPLVTRGVGVILSTRDGLGIFVGTSNTFPGFDSYQPITSTVAPAQPIASAAGGSNTSSAIAAYRLGQGIVVDIGLSGFGSKLSHSVDAQELTRRLWTILSH